MATAADAWDTQPLDDTDEGWAKRWELELTSSAKHLEKFHAQGDKVVARFLDDRKANEDGTRWNLFTANVKTIRANVYGKTPSVSVERRFGDAADDAARVAAEIQERMLNCDIERASDGFVSALESALDDRLLVGLGTVWLRYEVETEEVAEKPEEKTAEGIIKPAVPGGERKRREDVAVDYVHWKDLLWSPARVWSEARWLARGLDLSREDLKARWPKLADKVPMRRGTQDGDDTERKREDPIQRARVWEIWDKESGQKFFFALGMRTILERQEDELGLDGFFPCPRPMVANVTTRGFVPRPDFVLNQDLYNEIDDVSARITRLEQGLILRGVYDRRNNALSDLLSTQAENKLIPSSENWESFAERGGLEGAIAWMPLKPIIEALLALRDYRSELVERLYQLDGMADIMRGQATQAGATATEQRIKAQFGSVRLQALQDEFARFASDAQRIKAQIIAKHFDAEIIRARSNADHLMDKPEVVEQALQLIKERHSDYRVAVKPENVNLTDYASMRQERVEVVEVLAKLMTAAQPLIQQSPAFAPHVGRIMQWVVAGTKGSGQIEGVLDQAISESEQAAQNPQQQADPKMAVEQAKQQTATMKAQADIQKVQLKAQADERQTMLETESKIAIERAQAEEGIREKVIGHQLGEQARQSAAMLKPKPANGAPK